MGIPGELSDKIIDVLRDDKATLLSCSLVSKNWTLRSQYHLFKTVTIVCPSVEEQFAFVEWLHHSDSEHLRMFLRTLKIQTEFTKNLRITRYHLNTGRIRQEFLRFDALERMLRQLPNLDRLELRGMYWIQRDPGGLLRSLNLPGGVDSVIKPLPPFPQVTSLVISGAQSPWMLPDLYYIFDFFPSLKNLRLEHSLELIMEGREGDPGFPEHIRLDTLQIDGVCSISWDSVFPSSALMNLRELRIQPTWAIRPLVDKCLSSVKTLWLDIDDRLLYDAYAFEQLQHLWIWSSCQIDKGKYFGTTTPWLSASDLEYAHTLKRISILLPPPPYFYPAHVFKWDWKSFNSVLVHFKNTLETLEVVYSVPEEDVDEEDLFGGRYYQLDQVFESFARYVEWSVEDGLSFAFMYKGEVYPFGLKWRLAEGEA